MDPEAVEVKAAGGVVWRREDAGAPEIAVVHRPRYDDWSLPKGKLDPGEDWQTAALREVWRRSACAARWATSSRRSSTPTTRGARRPSATGSWSRRTALFAPNDEVDEMRWLDIEAAAALLTHAHDAELVRAAGERL